MKSTAQILNLVKIFSIIILMPIFARSEGCKNEGETVIPNPINACTFSDLVRDFTQIILEIGLPLAALFIILAGFQFVTAQGNAEKIKKARQTLTWTIIGAAVIIGARVIAEAVVNFAKGLGE